MNLLLKFLISFGVVLATATAGHFVSMEKRKGRDSFVQKARSDSEMIHQLVFAIQQKNVLKLETLLLERSIPGNPLYQQWLTFEQVGELTSNPQSAKAVLDWLAANDVKVTWQSAHQDYIKAEAKISVWEHMLQTKFYEFDDLSKIGVSREKNGKKIGSLHRTDEYFLPQSIKEHLSAVFNTVQTPPEFHPRYARREGERKGNEGGEEGKEGGGGQGEATPAFRTDLTVVATQGRSRERRLFTLRVLAL